MSTSSDQEPQPLKVDGALLPYPGYNSSPNRIREYSNVTPEFIAFMGMLEAETTVDTDMVHITDEDLFSLSENCSVAHCVSEDMEMCRGIAAMFRLTFGRVDELLDQNKRTGSLAVLRNNNAHFIYYLVTKPLYSDIPSLFTLWQSLIELTNHCRNNQVKYVAMPRIGCGVDMLRWEQVFLMIKFLFRSTYTTALICFQTTPWVMVPLTKCQIIFASEDVLGVDKQDAMLFFGTRSTSLSRPIATLMNSFQVSKYIERPSWAPGYVVQTQTREYNRNNTAVFGLIVRINTNSRFRFSFLYKCVHILKAMFNKQKIRTIAFEEAWDEDDDLLTRKILAIFAYEFDEITITVCRCTTRPIHSTT